MKLIDRYIGREILITALVGVTVLSVVLVLGQLFLKMLDVLISHDVPMDIIISVVAYILPFSLTYTIPWGFLTAVLLVYGRLSAENELIAFKSSGVSITRISAALFLLSFICVGICLWINLEVAPRAQEKMKNAIVNIVTNNPLSLFGSDHIIDEFPGRKIYVEEKNGTQLKNILVYEMDKNSNLISVIFAKKGELQARNGEVLLHIYDARFEQRDVDSPADFNKIQEGEMKESVFTIPLKELYEKSKKARQASQMQWEELLKQEEPNPWIPPEVIAARESVKRTEFSRRFSFSLASFALALIAVPLAVTAHRRETSIGFLFSIIVGFTYFFMGELIKSVQEKPKLHPELLIWAPNVIFILLGGFLFWRLSRK